MRFFWPFIWALAISGVVSYVLSSMAGNAFNLMHTIILAIIMSAGIFVLGEGVIEDESSN
ncbi:DUF2929 family protein [Virgibacillus doumboii]|uniref:DUF2929 family protein n=1 Tax=Virgibacillus doumboii TaxID=2697503 RepID=UPI0013E07142|nr:DUF2929 family protein [Virgibacillus doumboii]